MTTVLTTATTSSRLARYEAALETLTLLIAETSSQLFELESRAASTGLDARSDIEERRATLREEERRLRFGDDAGIERVLRLYAPLARASVEPHRATCTG